MYVLRNCKIKPILVAAAVSIVAAFFLGICSYNYGMPDLKVIRKSGQYKIRLKSGHFGTYAFYKHNSYEINNEDLNQCVFRIKDESGKDIVEYDHEIDQPGNFFPIIELKGYKGIRLKRFEVSKDSLCTIETLNHDKDNYIFILAPIPTPPIKSDWFIAIFQELPKHNLQFD